MTTEVSCECTGCGSRLRIEDGTTGQVVQCPKCGGDVIVPEVHETSPAAATVPASKANHKKKVVITHSPAPHAAASSPRLPPLAPHPPVHAPAAPAVTAAPEGPGEVVVTDIRMPFGSMVAFMVKWSLAAIPALAILFLILLFFVKLMGGTISSMRPASSDDSRPAQQLGLPPRSQVQR